MDADFKRPGLLPVEAGGARLDQRRQDGGARGRRFGDDLACTAGLGSVIAYGFVQCKSEK